MKVRDVMTKTVACCLPETNLAAAGALMWETDCGVLPVVNDQRKSNRHAHRPRCLHRPDNERPAGGDD